VVEAAVPTVEIWWKASEILEEDIESNIEAQGLPRDSDEAISTRYCTRESKISLFQLEIIALPGFTLLVIGGGGHVFCLKEVTSSPGLHVKLVFRLGSSKPRRDGRGIHHQKTSFYT
jgi:hypothetical protein